MDITDIRKEFTTRAASVPAIGKKLKMLIDDQPVIIDGTGEVNEVRGDDEVADCTIAMSMDSFIKTVKGELNPMMAVMTGKIKVKGDMALAMKLKDLLS